MRLSPALLSDLDKSRSFTPRIMRWGLGAILAIILSLTALSFWRVELANRALDEIVSHEQVAVELLYRMQLATRERTFALLVAVHLEDPFARDSQIQRFYAQGNAFVTARTRLNHLPLTPTERTLLAQQDALIVRILPAQQRVIELLESGRLAEAERALMAHVMPPQNKIIDTLAALLKDAITRTQGHASSARKAQKHATILFVFGGLAGLLLIGGVYTLVTRKMYGLVSHLTHVSERLQQSNQDLQFQKMALDEHNIVSVSDLDGNIIEINTKFCETSQYTRDELLGQNHRLLKSGQHPDAFYDELWITISSGKVWHGEICNRRKDGSFYWVASTILPFVGEDGLPIRYVSVRTDITAIKEAQLVLTRSRDELEQQVQARTHELAEREEVLRTITSAAQDAVMMIDHAGLVTYWNPAAEQLFGHAEDAVLGQNLHELIVPARYLERAHAGFSHFAQSGEGPAIGKTTTLRAKHRDGHEFPVDISLSAIKLRGQWNAVGIVRDATERVETEKRLQQLATTDTLTGICNRRRFDEVLENEIHRAARFCGPLSLILFDIDHFKHINDSFGHLAGDRVLVGVARIVSGSIRTTDLFARWGGEEFIILMPGAQPDDAHLVAEKLRLLLEQQPFADVAPVTASFGVTSYAPGDDADGLLKKLDLCLYQAKAAGRNCVEVCVPPPMAKAI